MNPFNKVAAVMLSVMVVGCAVSADPREQSTGERIWASISGLDEKPLPVCRKNWIP